MSLQQTPQSRVFVELLPWADRGRENYLLSGGETLPGLRRPLSSAPAQTPSREVHVSGTAEVSASPDRAQVVVRVSSTKEAAAEAKKSVCRRLDYITQSLRQQGVQSENVTVTKDFKRLENAYHMEAEVCITFTEFGKMQNICNFLVEKLDSSVVISQPQFYHMPGSVDNLRCLRPGRGPRFSRSQNRSTANPRRDAATRGPRDSDRLLPSVESLGGS
uniref:Interleukin 1 receptor associated kinase 1 binding protein 1 n=1 Tax=Capra hircus TaxID=9925 RepID=A0A8C2XX76_CAPHI